MANAMSQGLGAPPAPNPTPQPDVGGANAFASGAPSNGGAANAPQQGQPQPPPPPNQQQTVAALRHFSALEKELTILLSDPSVGRSNLKSKIQDGAVTLVSNGIMSATQAVTMLGTVPDEPFKQKQWLEQHFQDTVKAADAILAHHQAGFLGQPGGEQPSSDPADHIGTMRALAESYGGAATHA